MLEKRRRPTIKAVQKIQNYLKLSDEDMSDLMKVKISRYRNIKKSPSSLRLTELSDLSESLGLDKLNILDDEIDYEVLKKRNCGEDYILPAKYRKTTGSKIRTLKKILNPLSASYGDAFQKKILNRFQINPIVMKEDHFEISVLLVNDVINFLKEEWDINRDYFFSFGRFSHCQVDDKALFDCFQGIKTQKTLYEKMFTELTPYYEKNYCYKLLKLDEKSARIECKTKENIQESFGKNFLSSLEACSYREGVISSLPRLIGKSFSSVKVLSSTHRGDPSAIYEVGFRNETPFV